VKDLPRWKKSQLRGRQLRLLSALLVVQNAAHEPSTCGAGKSCFNDAPRTGGAMLQTGYPPAVERNIAALQADIGALQTRLHDFMTTVDGPNAQIPAVLVEKIEDRGQKEAVYSDLLQNNLDHDAVKHVVSDLESKILAMKSTMAKVGVRVGVPQSNSDSLLGMTITDTDGPVPPRVSALQGMVASLAPKMAMLESRIGKQGTHR